MQPIWSNLAVVAVTAIFYAWKAHVQERLRKQQRLRERVAYLQWVMADRTATFGRLAEAE